MKDICSVKFQLIKNIKNLSYAKLDAPPLSNFQIVFLLESA